MTSARAWLATVEIMTGVALAHAWAGGGVELSLLALVPVVLGATLVVQRWRPTLPLMLTVVAGAHLALHAPVVEPATHHLHGHAEASTSWAMVCAHVVSVVLTAVVWLVRRRVDEQLRTVFSPAPALPAHVAAPRALATQAVVPNLCFSVVSRRGPPVSAFA